MNKQTFRKKIDQHLSPLETNEFDKRRIFTNATKENEKGKRMKLLPILVLSLVLLLAGTVVALTLSPTIKIFGRFYGAELQTTLEQGKTLDIQKQHEVGQIVYTLYDVVYADGTVYGSGEIHPKKDENVILLAADVGGVHSKARDSSMAISQPDEKFYHATENDPTYAQLAKEKDAKILMVRATTNNIMANGELITGDVGEMHIPMADGGIYFTLELPLESPLEGDDATLSLDLYYFEVTPEDEYLMDTTKVSEDWVIPITFKTE